MSEPWVRQEDWSEELQFTRTMATSNMLGGGGGNGGSGGGGGEGSNLMNGSFSQQQPFGFANGNSNNNNAFTNGLYIAEHDQLPIQQGMNMNMNISMSMGLGHRLGYSSHHAQGHGGGNGANGLLEASLPQMLDQYSAIYNKNGRIGIYTREVSS